MGGPGWKEIADKLHEARDSIDRAIDNVGQAADEMAKQQTVTMPVEQAEVLRGVTTLPEGVDVG